MQRKLTNPHDKLFRALIERTDLAWEMVREQLPQELIDRTAGWSFERLPDSVVDHELELELCNGLFRMQDPEGKEPDVYLILARLSEYDPLYVYKCGQNAIKILNWHIRQDFATSALRPLVIPFLVYHGKKPWLSYSQTGQVIVN